MKHALELIDIFYNSKHKTFYIAPKGEKDSVEACTISPNEGFVTCPVYGSFSPKLIIGFRVDETSPTKLYLKSMNPLVGKPIDNLFGLIDDEDIEQIKDIVNEINSRYYQK